MCASMTPEFLEFTKRKGNDLITPHPPSFPGLKPGDRWCLCAHRWVEAQKAGVAPPIVADATNEAATSIVPREILASYHSTSSKKILPPRRYVKQ